MKKQALLLTILMFLSKIIGFLRESILSYYYGITEYADIYFISNSIPSAVFGFVAAGLVSTFIPIYSRVVHREGEDRAKDYLDNILTIVFFITLIFAALGLLYTEPLVKLFAPGFTGKTLETTYTFVRISLFAILTNGIFSILGGYHQYHDRFYVNPVAGFMMNFVTISTIIISAKTDPILLAYGIVLSSLAQMLVVYYFAKRKGDYHYRFKINLKDEYLKPMLIMAVPIIIGASINQVNTVIDRRLATSISEGAVATLNYGSKISDSVYALFVTTITTVMYPALTKQAAKNDFDSLKATVTNIMNTVTLIVIPASIGMMVLSEPIVELFLGRGEFAKDPNALSLTAGVMFFYAIGNIGYGLRDVLVRTFYALQDSVTPVISGVISVVINIALNIILSRRMGVSGLALATSISALFSVLVLYISLYLKVEGMSLRKFLVSSTKIGIASIFMGIAAYYTNGFFVAKGLDYKIGLFAGIGVGVIFYGVIMHFMKVEEFDELIDMVRDRIRKKRHA